jgi:methionine synthase II (cobalamin-independent)
MGKTNTAMIGSLPQKNPGDALAALLSNSLAIPTWPQLPKRSFKESMLVQYSEGLPGIAVDEVEKKVWLKRDAKLLDEMACFYDAVIAENVDAFAISADYSAGIHAFLRERADLPGMFPAIKGQVTGPFTFGLALSDETGRAAWFDEQYRDIVVKGVAMKALWQVKQLEKYAGQVIISLDEPIFSALGTPAYMGIENEQVIAVLDEIAGMIHQTGAMVSVHCCGNMEWSLLARSSIDIISFDAYSFGDKVSLYPEEITAFLERGGILAWGMVPTSPSEAIAAETVKSLVDRTHDLEKLFIAKNVPPALLFERRIFTPSCGMGNLTDAEAQRVLTLLSALSGEIPQPSGVPLFPGRL